MIPVLRDYQSKLKSDLLCALDNGSKKVLVVLPTSGGKTTVFADFVTDALQEGKRSLIVAHRRELIDQPVARLEQFDVMAGVVMAARNQETPVTVASIQTLARRKLKRSPNYIIIDECHRANSKSYVQLLKDYPEAIVIGFTATPIRTDNKFLGDVFETMVNGPTVAQLTEWQYITPVICYGPQEINTSGIKTVKGDYDQQALYDLFDKPVLYDGAVKHWQKYANKKPSIIFCQSVGHSKKTAEAFRENGVKTGHVDGETSDEERKQLFEDLASGKLTVLCNYGIAVEGVDIACIECVVLNMATLSLSKYLQAIGRAVRLSEGKEHAILIDFGGNVKRHGFPSDERQWQLAGKPKKPGVCPIKECPECYLLLHTSAPCCTDCGYVFPKKKEEVKEAEFEVLIPSHLAITPALMDVATLLEASKYYGGQRWLLQQLRIRTAESVKLELQGAHFASGMEYAATKKQVGLARYTDFLGQVAAIKNYDPLWVRRLASYY